MVLEVFALKIVFENIIVQVESHLEKKNFVDSWRDYEEE